MLSWRAGLMVAWTVGMAAIALLPLPARAPVVVVHWANSHMARPNLLPRFAAEFTAAGHRTASGRPIEVRVQGYGSAETADDLVSRVTRGVPLDPTVADPTIVTPSADHWLVWANHAAGRTVIDLARSRSIARTWIGIATFRDMAECLGWPAKELGLADVVALRQDPHGWARYPCAKAEWGQRPLVAFTDPLTSSTGRSMLFSLYAIAAGKPPEQLTIEDVSNPDVVAYVRRFQRVVDHYVVGTLPLNTQIYEGPRYGHFFFVPEDNLVSLYQGEENLRIGMEIRRQPITRPMVVIYPKEGSTAHNHSAGLVRAPWVTPEHTEAAERWVAYLHGEDRQRALMDDGFRPATAYPVSDPISGRYGLDPFQPRTIVNPDAMAGDVMARVIGAWDDVKRPGVVTFAVDTSSSMEGPKLAEAQRGLVGALDSLSKHTHAGFVAFAEGIEATVPVAPLPENRVRIAGAVQGMRARGGGALYDAIKAAVEMTDRAPAEPDAIRAVVVLTDGQATRGTTALHDLVRMVSRDGEVPIAEFRGFDGDAHAVDARGRVVPKEAVVGTGLALTTRHPVLIFVVGVGDADRDIARILGQATGAGSQSATELDLATVLAAFGKYF
jgi:Ca-activated chloride channel family protein